MEVNRIFRVALDCRFFTEPKSLYYDIDNFRELNNNIENLRIFLMVPCIILDEKVPKGFKTVKDTELLGDTIKMSLFISTSLNFGKRVRQETKTPVLHDPDHLKSTIITEFDRTQIKTTHYKDFKDHLSHSDAFEGWVYPDGSLVIESDLVKTIRFYDHYTDIRNSTLFNDYEKFMKYFINSIVKNNFMKVRI